MVKKVKLYPFGFRERVVTCNQVDSTRLNKFLDGCRDSLNSFYGHDSIKSAVNSFLSCLPPKNSDTDGIANIFGCGSSGCMNWGGGASKSNDYTQIIKSSLVIYWLPELERLRHANINFLKLGSCNVGAGLVGAQLLWEIAQATKCIVMGGTGKLFCGKDGLNWEEGSVFQYGYPDSARPQPAISAPQRFFGAKDQQFLNLINPETQDVEPINISDISQLSFLPYRKTTSTLKLFGDQAKALLNQVNFENPLLIEGTPASYIDGELILEMAGKQPRNFTMFSCFLIEDKANPGIFYETTAAFLEEVKATKT